VGNDGIVLNYKYAHGRDRFIAARGVFRLVFVTIQGPHMVMHPS
jgi:hypothetical protein